MNPVDLFNGGERLDMFSLGLYLGPFWNEEEKRAANIQGIRLFQHLGVIPARGVVVTCPIANCGKKMRDSTDRGRKLGWNFRCPVRHRLEPTKNTFIDSARLSEMGADKIVKLLYFWLTERSVESAVRNIHVSSDTAVAWYQNCRDVARKIAWHDFNQLGGKQDIVEVDELHLFKSKHNVGQSTTWKWVFGGISRTTKKKFAVLVENHNFLPIMQDYIDSDSFICSNKTTAYDSCNEAFAGHGTVNHSIEFVSPARLLDPIWVEEGQFNKECLDNFIGPAPGPNLVPLRYHTQNIQRAWRGLKGQFGACTTLTHADSYLGEWMYRQNILRDIQSPTGQFVRFCQDIRRAYPGIGKIAMEAKLENCQCDECEP